MLDLAESYVLLNRSGKAQRDLLRGRTLINLFFEDSTRTRTSFELAGKRLGADVINMSVSTSSVNKGETLLDTAATLNAMQCDLLVVRHGQSTARIEVAVEHLRHGGMQRDEAALPELGPPDQQNVVGLYVVEPQVERLRDAQPGRGDQPEECRVHLAPERV